MREILFRGKIIDEPNEFVYGKLVVNESKNDYIIHSFSGEHIGAFHVDPHTVGQYIRRKDSNENKIFVGDILYEESHGCEAWGDREFKIEKWFIVKGFTYKGIDIEKIKEIRGNYAWGYDECTKMYAYFGELRGKISIIGNIHDNPEIIEDAKSFVFTDKYVE